MAKTNANLIWNIADVLRGPYQPNQYRDVILPFTNLRRLDLHLGADQGAGPCTVQTNTIKLLFRTLRTRG